MKTILALLFIAWSALAQAPIQRTPFTTNLTAGPVISPAYVEVGSLFSKTNAVVAGPLRITNSAGGMTTSLVVNTQQFVVASNLVGIGVSTPSNTLQVVASTAAIAPLSLDNANSAAIGNARGTGAVDLQYGRASATQIASGINSVITGGTNNTASGSTSAIMGGTGNIASGSLSASLGSGCTASGISSTAMGVNSSSADYATTIGYDGLSHLKGQFTIGNQRIAAVGDAQMSVIVARQEHNVAVAGASTNILVNGYYALVIPLNTTWVFKAQVVGRTTDAGTGNEESAAYTVEGCIERANTAVSTALVGAPIYVALAEDDAAWVIAVSADTTNGALTITVTGNNETTIRWVATVYLTQVSG